MITLINNNNAVIYGNQGRLVKNVFILKMNNGKNNQNWK